MALQLRRLIPHRYAGRAAALALPPPPGAPPAMLQFGVSQRCSYNFMPYSLSNNSSRQLSSIGSRLPLQLKSGAFFTTGLMGNPNFVSLRAAYRHGISLRANNIRNSRSFLTLRNTKVAFPIRNKCLFGNPNMRKEDGTVAHSMFHRSEKRKCTLAACGTITDEASTSTSKRSKSGTGTKRTTTRRKSPTSRKKEASEDMKEEKASTKKQRKSVKTSTAATKSRKIGVNQDESKSDISTSKKAADSPKEKKTSNRSKKSSKAKESAASNATAKAEICTTTSVSEQKPLVPLYPPTAKSVLVVESVTKAKVIQKYLGDMYEVLPSYGHVRDLAGRSKSVRPDDDFSMVWEVPAAAWTHLKSIRTALKGYDNAHLNSKKLDQLSIRSQEEAHNIEKRIYSSQFEVTGIKRSKINKNPPMPYITSSLQQDAANKLHFSAGYTMKVAQKLYEGINLSSEEATGLITYIRTDGFHISDGAAEDILSLVKQRYGEEYASEGIRKYFKKVKNAQEAHEAIRPTSIRRLPSSLVGALDDDSLKLYTLIWKRTMACQMEASRTDMIQIDIGNSEGDMIFHSSASRLDFKGYQAVYDDTEASPSSYNSEVDAVHQDNFETLSKLEVKDLVSPVNVHLSQHFTKPPPRYSESALIKKLEELGIGRPSTYASIMRVLQVSAFLMHHFSEVADLSFTANMETELDNVSAGSTEWKGLLKDFWERFNKYCGDASRLDVRKVERMLEEKFGSILFSDLDNDSRICPRYIARTLSDDDDETEASDETQRTFTPRLLGALPDSDEKVFLKQGPYGHYVQVGEDRKGVSPKRAPLSEVKDIDSITLKDAIELLQYPKILGKHPDDDLPVLITHSKAGFSIRHRRTLASLPKSADPKKITLERALKLLTGKNLYRAQKTCQIIHP
uniref:Topo IA-type catalytic domain-containing protein n=1 Tax=Oryza meridionalis TaxID=40149 RepID=A0A0E0E0K2_9ORYZ